MNRIVLINTSPLPHDSNKPCSQLSKYKKTPPTSTSSSTGVPSFPPSKISRKISEKDFFPCELSDDCYFIGEQIQAVYEGWV